MKKFLKKRMSLLGLYSRNLHINQYTAAAITAPNASISAVILPLSATHSKNNKMYIYLLLCDNLKQLLNKGILLWIKKYFFLLTQKNRICGEPLIRIYR